MVSFHLSNFPKARLATNKLSDNFHSDIKSQFFGQFTFYPDKNQQQPVIVMASDKEISASFQRPCSRFALLILRA